MMPRIEILDIIDLPLYDHDLDALYHKLLTLCRERFEPHQKIVIHHYETEYFFPGHITGVTTHNLMTIIASLGISLSVFVIFTTYTRYRDSIAAWITSADDEPDIRVTLAHPAYVQYLPRDPETACGIHRDICYHALCIMGRPRPHKDLLLRWMLSRGLLGKIQVNYNTIADPSKNSCSQVPSAGSVVSDLGLVYTRPHRGSGGSALLPVRRSEIAALAQVQIPPQLVSDIIPLPRDDDNRGRSLDYPHDFFRHVAFAVTVDNTLDNDHQYPISEKIMKPMLTQTPIVVLGARHLLGLLREHGFETFGKWWDESYDNIQDPQDRFLAVCRSIESLTDQPIENMRSMYQDMLPILQHNQTLLIDYIDNELPRQYNKYWNA